MAKCCENCSYGAISERRENSGNSCCVLCLRRTDIKKGRVFYHSKDDICKGWQPVIPEPPKAIKG